MMSCYALTDFDFVYMCIVHLKHTDGFQDKIADSPRIFLVYIGSSFYT